MLLLLLVFVLLLILVLLFVLIFDVFGSREEGGAREGSEE